MNRTKKIALLGVLLAFSLLMSMVEQLLPPLPFLPPNVRLGLSNIATMYCIFFIGSFQAVLLSSMKSIFVFFFRGFIAGLLSFSGGMLAIVMIIVMARLGKDKISYISLSISGAITHNIAQISIYSLLLQTDLLMYYLPFLVIAGLIMGILTGTILNTLFPIFLNRFK